MLVLHQAHVLVGVRARRDLVQRSVVRKAEQLLLEERRGLGRAPGLDQRLRIVVDQLHLVRIAEERGLEALRRGVVLLGAHQHVARHRLDHRMRRRDRLEVRELGLGARQLLRAQQRRDEPVALGDLVVVLLLPERDVERRHLLARVALVALQERADEVEVERVRHLLVRQALRARLRLGDPLVRDRVRAQVRRRRALDEAARALQLLHERRHGVGIEARGDEAREADAVGLVLVLAREVDLVLRLQRLRAGDRRLHRLAAVRAAAARARIASASPASDSSIEFFWFATMRAMWRCVTCEISCDSTLASSDSFCASRMRPVWTPM